VRTVAATLRRLGYDDHAIAASLNAVNLPRPPSGAWSAGEVATLLAS
jgi:hypothetical protein